ncbi:MAG: hypothetical protein RBS57_19290 [Desulforhabdus sp.]|nr:hypothetical protein [Desulforhabdus sp.]
MKRARFVAAARRELLAEVAYYSEVEPGLRKHFTKAIKEATALALTFPQAGFSSAAIPGTSWLMGFRSLLSTGRMTPELSSLPWPIMPEAAILAVATVRTYQKIHPRLVHRYESDVVRPVGRGCVPAHMIAPR